MGPITTFALEPGIKFPVSDIEKLARQTNNQRRPIINSADSDPPTVYGVDYAPS